MVSTRQASRRPVIILTALVVIFTVLVCAVVIYYWEEVSEVQQYGYLGAFVFGFIAGSSIPVPLPYLVLTFTLGGVGDWFNAALVGIFSGLGAGIGGTLVYLFGRGGSTLLQKCGLSFLQPEACPDPKAPATNPRVARFLDLARRRGAVVVFLMSAMLNPLFAPMAIAMGALRFRLGKFLFWCVAGNMVKSLVIAYAGYYGLGSLLRWLGAA